MSPQVWLITGASSGFGKIVTELVLSHGGNVVGASIGSSAISDLVEKYTAVRLINLEIDVTKPEQVASAFSSAHEKFGQVDVVFNNAGVGFLCEAEGMPEALARKTFEVNFWGSTYVAREAVRVFREVNGPKKGGKLLQMASMLGVGRWAGLAYYTASKHAVEGFTKVLISELNPEWNIQVMLIEPDFFRTPMVASDLAVIQPMPAYVGGAADQSRHMTTAENIKGDPQKAMEMMYNAAQLDKLPLHLPIGPGAIGMFNRTEQELKTAVDEWATLANQTDFD